MKRNEKNNTINHSINFKIKALIKYNAQNIVNNSRDKKNAIGKIFAQLT